MVKRNYNLESRRELFLKHARDRYGDKYMYDINTYINFYSPMRITCPIHGKFYARADSHLRSDSGCPKCSWRATNRTVFELRSTPEYIERRKNILLAKAYKKFGNKFKYHTQDYVNSYSRIRIECPIHGVFVNRLSLHIASLLGCKKCNQDRRDMLRSRVCTDTNQGVVKVTYKDKKRPRVDTIEQRKQNFLNKATARFENKFKYFIDDYKSFASPIRIVCPIHGLFLMAPAIHLKSSTGCDGCYNTKRIMTGMSEKSRSAKANEFLKKARAKYGDKFKYYLEDYSAQGAKIRIECPKHGIFEYTPTAHLGSIYGCYACAREYVNAAISNKPNTTQEFIAKASKKFNNKFNYEKVVYENAVTYVNIVCPVHGQFTTTPASHLGSKYGCYHCGKEARKVSIKSFK